MRSQVRMRPGAPLPGHHDVVDMVRPSLRSGLTARGAILTPVGGLPAAARRAGREGVYCWKVQSKVSAAHSQRQDVPTNTSPPYFRLP